MALVSPPSSPTVELRRCEALLVDEETVCKASIWSSRGRFCNAHGREYVQLTRAYKSVSKTVEELKKQAWISRKQLRALHDITQVDLAIDLAEQWREAITEEILARQVQHRRFFVTKDKGHQQWLEHLSVSETKAEELIARLRVRKLEIVSAVEARRRIEEWQAEREAETAHARELLQRHIQETARRVDLAARAAETTTGAIPAPVPAARKVEANSGVGRAQRPHVYAPGGSSAYSYSSRVDLESQTPIGEPDQGCNVPWLLISLFLMWLFWTGVSSG